MHALRIELLAHATQIAKENEAAARAEVGVMRAVLADKDTQVGIFIFLSLQLSVLLSLFSVRIVHSEKGMLQLEILKEVFAYHFVLPFFCSTGEKGTLYLGSACTSPNAFVTQRRNK